MGVVTALRNMGLQCHLVTGDNWRTARIVADQLGIINVQAEVLPAGKADVVRSIQFSWHIPSKKNQQKARVPTRLLIAHINVAYRGCRCGLCSRHTRQEWPWWEMASMTPLHLCKPMSALPLAQVLHLFHQRNHACYFSIHWQLTKSFTTHMCGRATGTDIAVEAADYVLMRSDLEGVLTALDLSKKTFRRIYYNYGWAFIYNLLMVPLAAGILYPPLHFQLPPWVRRSLN